MLERICGKLASVWRRGALEGNRAPRVPLAALLGAPPFWPWFVLSLSHRQLFPPFQTFADGCPLPALMADEALPPCNLPTHFAARGSCRTLYAVAAPRYIRWPYLPILFLTLFAVFLLFPNPQTTLIATTLQTRRARGMRRSALAITLHTPPSFPPTFAPLTANLPQTVDPRQQQVLPLSGLCVASCACTRAPEAPPVASTQVAARWRRQARGTRRCGCPPNPPPFRKRSPIVLLFILSMRVPASILITPFHHPSLYLPALFFLRRGAAGGGPY